VIDLEPHNQAVEMFTRLTEKYTAITEADLDITQIYQNRANDERPNLFA
jgi:hypothetical protein